jgi:hypothetical protein
VVVLRLPSRLIPLLLTRRRLALLLIAVLTAFLGWRAVALRIDTAHSATRANTPRRWSAPRFANESPTSG